MLVLLRVLLDGIFTRGRKMSRRLILAFVTDSLKGGENASGFSTASGP